MELDHTRPEELVAVFDADGTPTGTAPRSQVYAQGLWHASAGVMVRSGDLTRVYVHRRTDTKAVFPGLYDCLAGGVLDPGEVPEQAAARELGEELGVTGVRLRPLARCSWDGNWAGVPLRCHLFAFVTEYDGPIVHQESEIADGGWWTREDLARHLADRDWPFVPDTRALLATLPPGGW